MRQNLLFLTGVLGVIVAWGRGALIFGGTEFSGGTLARYNDDGILLFLVALVLTFRFPRTAAAIALIACCLSLPLYADLMFPRPFRQVWPGEWKVRQLPVESFIWDGWWAAGILSIGLSALISGVVLTRSLVTRLAAHRPY